MYATISSTNHLAGHGKSDCFALFHRPLHIRTEQEVKPSYLCLINVLYLDDVADVGLSQSIELLHLFNGIIVLVLQQVSSAEFVKVALGVVGVSVLTLAWYLVRCA